MSNLPVPTDYDQHDFNGNRDKIIDLAGRGFSGAYIARATGLSETFVYTTLKREYIERYRNRQNIIEAQDQTIQWLKLKLTNRIHKAGDNFARQDVDLLVKLLERQAKLHGIDAAVQHQHQVNVTIEELSDEDVIRQLRAEGLEIKQLPPPTPVIDEPKAEDAEYVEAIPEIDKESNESKVPNPNKKKLDK